MKTKIQIKSFFGSVLFEFEKENNTIKDTLVEAVRCGADLSGAVLSGADLSGAVLSGADLRGVDLSDAVLRGADLSGADLRGADLSGADLRGAVLRGADLSDAVLSDADLSGAVLRGADLSGADLSGTDLSVDGKPVKIKKAAVFTGLYKYLAMSFITEDDVEYVKLGCYTRKIEDWEKDFWNNENEFPNDNSTKSQLRVLAYETCKKWLEINKKENTNK